MGIIWEGPPPPTHINRIRICGMFLQVIIRRRMMVASIPIIFFIRRRSIRTYRTNKLPPPPLLLLLLYLYYTMSEWARDERIETIGKMWENNYFKFLFIFCYHFKVIHHHNGGQEVMCELLSKFYHQIIKRWTNTC